MRSCRQALVIGLAGLALLAATARPVWGQMYAGLISPSVTHVELMQRRGKAPIYLVPTNPPAPPYQIGPGDLLDVNVWDNPQLTQSVEVRPDGWITLPLIGDVKAANLALFKSVEASSLPPTLVIVHVEDKWIGYGRLLDLSDPLFRSKFIFTVSQGPVEDQKVIRAFPDRQVWDFHPDQPVSTGEDGGKQ